MKAKTSLLKKRPLQRKDAVIDPDVELSGDEHQVVVLPTEVDSHPQP